MRLKGHRYIKPTFSCNISVHPQTSAITSLCQTRTATQNPTRRSFCLSCIPFRSRTTEQLDISTCASQHPPAPSRLSTGTMASECASSRRCSKEHTLTTRPLPAPERSKPRMRACLPDPGFVSCCQADYPWCCWVWASSTQPLKAKDGHTVHSSVVWAS